MDINEIMKMMEDSANQPASIVYKKENGVASLELKGNSTNLLAAAEIITFATIKNSFPEREGRLELLKYMFNEIKKDIINNAPL